MATIPRVALALTLGYFIKPFQGIHPAIGNQSQACWWQAGKPAPHSELNTT